MRNSASGAQDRGVNVGLLVLRLGAGLSLFLFFGWQKLHDASAYLRTGQWTFVDFNRKVGLPFPVLVAFLQASNESVMAVFLAASLFSRISAACLTVGFAVATYCSLKAAEPAWMMAAYFCLMFLVLWLAGPGSYSLDQLLSSRFAKKIATNQLPPKTLLVP